VGLPPVHLFRATLLRNTALLNDRVPVVIEGTCGPQATRVIAQLTANVMKETWDSRIQRARRLAAERPESNELLAFYSRLLSAQKDIYEFLRTREGWLPCGEIARDLPVLRQAAPTLLSMVKAHGPEELASQAHKLLQASEVELADVLAEYWRTPADSQFFAKALLQPYLSWLREAGAKPVDRHLEGGENRCPFCKGKPQLSILQVKESSSESGGRDLICATCLLVWPFRRVVCANCGEEDPTRIGYYHAPEYDHVRVEACDTCRHYIKAVDLTRYGFAVPLVDEVACAPLDLWIRERGYTKIEMNLLGV
jgi:formate dehydrogenase maturation protein FdhE